MPVLDFLAIDMGDEVAGFQDAGGRGIVEYLADRRRIICGDGRQIDRKQNGDGQQQVKDGTCQIDDGLLPDGFVVVGSGKIGIRGVDDFLEFRSVHLDIAAQRQKPDVPARLSAFESADSRSETYRKAQNLDVKDAGRNVMPELVHEHEYADKYDDI